MQRLTVAKGRDCGAASVSPETNPDAGRTACDLLKPAFLLRFVVCSFILKPTLLLPQASKMV
jgi:hypothetical protein